MRLNQNFYAGLSCTSVLLIQRPTTVDCTIWTTIRCLMDLQLISMRNVLLLTMGNRLGSTSRTSVKVSPDFYLTENLLFNKYYENSFTKICWEMYCILLFKSFHIHYIAFFFIKMILPTFHTTQNDPLWAFLTNKEYF